MGCSVAIVGCGKVAKALGKFLADAGYHVVGVASKRLSSAKEAAKLFKTAQYSDIPWEITGTADVVLITTPDGVIAETCRLIAENNGFKAGCVVLHCSGALPSTILSAAGRCGAFTGSMHPLQSFASDDFSQNPFDNIIIDIEGEPQALAVARQMTVDLGATCLTIKTEAKTLYHAAAVTASNYLVTLLSLAFRLLADAGISAPTAYTVLQPLIKGTLSNVQTVGIPQALTGPIARGDIETVKRHLVQIKARTPDVLDLFKILSLHTVDIALAKGSLTDADAAVLRNLLT